MKRIKKRNILILLIVLLFILFLIFLKTPKDLRYFEVDNKDIYFIESEIEVYSKVKLSDLVYVENGKIEDQDIQTDKIGKQKVEVKYEKEDKKYITNINLDIFDSKEPYVGLFGSYTHTKGEELKIYDKVFAGDNYSGELKKEVIGEYDLNKVGSYNVQYKVTDEAGNSNIKKFTLKVVNPKPKPTGGGGSTAAPSVKLIPFDTLVYNTPENASLMIDVSKWQGDINWKKVKESGIEYAMLRIGTQKEVDQGSVKDQYFDINYEEAKKNGIKVGVYYFSYARDQKDAKEQAEWVLKTLGNKKLDLPVSFDWETWTLFNYFNISFYDLNQMAKTFMDTIEEKGYKSMNYGSKFYMELIWDLPEYPTWLAHYTSKTNYSKDYLMWQFTSKGEIPGIKGGVDVNYIYNK